MNTQVALWVGFNLFVIAMLAIDLGLFHRKDHAVTPKEAGVWTLVWISISMAFCAGLWHFRGGERRWRGRRAAGRSAPRTS